MALQKIVKGITKKDETRWRQKTYWCRSYVAF